MKQVLLTAIVAALVALGVGKFSGVGAGATSATVKESAYERVMRTGVLRCGFFEEAPFTMRDPNTGKLSGIAVELAEKITTDNGLKLEWAVPVNFGTIPEDLNSGRYDSLCASLFVLPRAGKVDYTTPYAMVSLYGYAKPDETRFNDLNHVNWAKVTIAGLDGEGATKIAQQRFAAAKFAVLPQTSQISDMLLSVATGKADIGFTMPSLFALFDTSNPGRLERVNNGQPLYTYALGFGLGVGNHDLKSFWDNGIRQLIVSGELAAMLANYKATDFVAIPTK